MRSITLSALLLTFLLSLDAFSYNPPAPRPAPAAANRGGGGGARGGNNGNNNGNQANNGSGDGGNAAALAQMAAESCPAGMTMEECGDWVRNKGNTWAPNTAAKVNEVKTYGIGIPEKAPAKQASTGEVAQ